MYIFYLVLFFDKTFSFIRSSLKVKEEAYFKDGIFNRILQKVSKKYQKYLTYTNFGKHLFFIL